MHGKGPSRPIDAASIGDEQSHDPESPTTKKSRKELQQLDAILADDSTPQNESVPKSNGETVDKQEVLSEIMVSDGHLNAPLCVSKCWRHFRTRKENAIISQNDKEKG